MNTKKLKMISLCAVIVAVLGLTVAFAALSRTLTISSGATMDRYDWDIHFKNISQPTLVGKATATATPTLADQGATINNMNVNLKEPNDKVIYTVDIENSGDINAAIASFNMPTFTEQQSQLIDFKAEYTLPKSGNNKEIEAGDILAAGEVRNVTITIAYKNVDASLLPSSSVTVNISYGINYVQTDQTTTTTTTGSIDQVTDCTEFTKKSTYEAGDLISVCNNTTGKSEDFYVITDNGTTVTALAKDNLLVGNTVIADWSGSEPVPTSITPIASNTAGYGLQSSTATGLTANNQETIVGAIKFSENNYFEDDGDLLPAYDDGSETPYVFDSNSTILNQ